MSADVSKERTRNYLHQIKGGVVYKAVAMLASFLAIPLMIRYLGQEQFGVWSTLLTVMSWIVLFDLGVGNGLRNKVAEALARNDKVEAANYIASGYSLIGLIALVLWALVTGASFFVPWQAVFNTQAIPEATLRLTVQVAVFFVVLNFWIGLIGAILGAVQKTAMTALSQLISNILALLFVFILTKTTEATLTYLAMAYGISLVVANIGLSWWFYHGHPELRPKPYLDKQHVSPLLSVGMQFFTIQIAVLVIFMTDKMLITQFFGPEYVTQYDVVFKLFSVITFAHTLITAPLWSAYTDAYHRNDLFWIKNMLKKQMLIFGLVALAVIAMVVMARPIIKLWIGHEFDVSFSLLISIGLFVLVSAWNNIFGLVLGGIGKIRLGSIYTIFTALLNIPLSYFIAVKLGFGVVGIILGTFLSITISSIISPIQVYFFIYTKTKNTFITGILR
jgi:O-antigen/teichoic acid export membrane protein